MDAWVPGPTLIMKRDITVFLERYQRRFPDLGWGKPMDRRQEIRDALNADEFDDWQQYEGTSQEHVYPTIAMLLEAWFPDKRLRLLEIGPGTMPWRIDAYFLEPSKSRATELKAKLNEKNGPQEVSIGYAEDMPYSTEGFDSVIMLNGFFQVQALYEAVLEINRVLKLGGRFAFNIHTGDEVNIIVGQVFGYRNLIRTLKQFGFEPLCVWEGAVNQDHRTVGTERQALIVVEKVRRAQAGDLNQPQLIPIEEGPDPNDQWYRGANIDLKGRESYLS